MDTPEEKPRTIWQKLGGSTWLLVALIVGLPLVCVVAYFFMLIGWSYLPDDWPTRGTIGDSFGVLTAFFTGAGFIGFLVALWLQRQDLKAQYEAIRWQIKEMEGQREELEMTRSVFQQQTFETTFFNMLRFLSEIEGGAVFSETTNSRLGVRMSPIGTHKESERITYTGSDAMTRGALFVINHVLRELRSSDYGREGIVELLERCFARNNNAKVTFPVYEYFIMYVKVLYEIYTLLNMHEREGYSVVRYYSIIRSQLNNQTVSLMALYALTDIGGNLFNSLVTYSQLKYLDTDIREMLAPHDFYPPSAFGE